MHVAVLGPLEVRGNDEEPVPLTGNKERLLLAVLSAECPAVVSAERLQDVLWDGEPPPTARKALQTHVVRLRSALEPDRPRGSPGRYVARRGPGYALTVEHGELDAQAFGDAVARGRALLSGGDPEAGLSALRDALRLWRGQPYADWPDAAFAEAERRRLEALHATATQSLLEAELEVGNHAAVLPQLERLVAEEPLHEDWWSLLSVALYRSGRQGDALGALRRARGVLAEELGVDPGPRLRGIEQALLEQEPGLGLPGQRLPADGDGGPDGGPVGGPRAARSAPPGDPAGTAGRGGVGAAPGPAPLVPGCPYKGLAPYGVEDAALFRGRERVVRRMLAALVDQPLLVVSGSSGAGKSSLVRAGLLPALAAGALPGCADRPQLLLTPGPRAVDSLASLAGDDPPEVAPVLVCDQLERLWASAVTGPERTAFLDGVLGLVDDGAVAACVLVVRGDHVGRLAEHPPTADRLAGALQVLPPLTELELREVVTAPAAAAGLAVEPELVDAVVQDVHGRPGALPLLSAALVGTWERRRGGRLSLGGYLAAGGVSGAVARTAEQVYEAMDPEERLAARHVLVRLVDHDDRGTLRPRRVPVAELDLEAPERRGPLELLVQRRLLTRDEDHVELAHEALLEAWPRLAGWLREDAEGRALRRHLAPAARDWDRAGRPDDELYRGARLEAALQLAGSEPEAARQGTGGPGGGDTADPPAEGAALTTLERDFLAASRQHAEVELTRARQRAERERAQHRRTRRLAVGLAVALVLALLAAGSAWRFQTAAEDRAEEARAAGTVADANRLAALSATVRSADLSLLLAAAAVTTARTPATEDGLLAALLAHRRATGVQRMGDRLVAAALSGDGSRLFASHGGAAWYLDRWDIRAGAAPARIAQLDPRMLAASPDGGLLLGASVLPEPYLTLLTDDGAEVVRLQGSEAVGGLPLDVAFDRDGTPTVLLARREQSGYVGVLARLDRDTGELAPFRQVGRSGEAGWLEGALAPDARTAVTWAAPRAVRADWLEVATGRTARLRLLDRAANGSRFFAFPNGAGQSWSDGAVTVYDATGRSRQTLDVHDARVLDAVVVPGRRLAVTAGEDGQVELWSVGGGRWTRVDGLTGHDAAVAAVEVGPDGRTLHTAGQDGLVITWDLAGEDGFGSPYPGLDDRWVSNRVAEVEPGRLVVAPTRTLSQTRGGLLTGPAEDTLGVAAVFLDPATGREVDRVPVGDTLPGTVFGSSVSVSPDRRWVAVTASTHTAVLDAATREVVARIRLPSRDPEDGLDHEPVWCTTWTADGSALLLGAMGRRGAGDGALVRVRTGTWRVGDRMTLGFPPQVMEWDPDRTWLAVGHDGAPLVTVLDGDLSPVADVNLGAGGFPYDLAFSPDGEWLAATGDAGTVAVAETGSWRLANDPPRVHGSIGLDVGWLDDRTVVTTGRDEMVALYDAERDLVRTARMPADDRPGEGYAYLVPGTPGEIVVHAGAVEGRRYPLDPAQWLARACGVVGRDLTEAEWGRYLPGTPYRPVCTGLVS